MKLYLSSYKLGDSQYQQTLKEWTADTNKCTAYISNAMDAGSRVQAIKERRDEDMQDLHTIGLNVTHIDLREYFGKKSELKDVIKKCDVLWVSGGNVFVLRQAMQLSGFDDILLNLKDSKKIYGAYSAGVCVLSSNLRGLDIVDDANAKPYGEQYETIWNGLGMINFAFAPHYKSDHPESADVDKEVAYCRKNNIPYRALRDGEVICMEL